MFNILKTAVLMAAITALFMAVGSAIGGRSGMMLALVVALGMNFFSYWFSDKLVLKMYKAQQVDDTSAPQFYAMVRELAAKARPVFDPPTDRGTGRTAAGHGPGRTLVSPGA